jgi:hypothetical protein
MALHFSPLLKNPITSTEYVEKVVNDPQKPTAVNNLVRGEMLFMNRSLFELFEVDSLTGVTVGTPARKPKMREPQIFIQAVCQPR